LIEEEARLALQLVFDELASPLLRAEPGLVAAALARARVGEDQPIAAVDLRSFQEALHPRELHQRPHPRLAGFERGLGPANGVEQFLPLVREMAVHERAVDVDAGDVGRAELAVHEVHRAGLQLEQRLRREVLAVQEEDEDPAIGPIGGAGQDDVGAGLDRDAGPLRDEIEVLHRLRLALFEDLEVVGGQAGDEAPVLVARDDVHFDQRGRRLEGRLLRGEPREENREDQFHGRTSTRKNSYLFFPAFWRKAIFDPSGDHAGRMTFFVVSICCFRPSSSISASRPAWFP
jgi:hypothetical protein